jgi:hypothetical protein
LVCHGPEVETELCCDIGHVPQDVAQLLTDPLLEQPVRSPVAQELLILAEQPTCLAGKTKEGHDHAQIGLLRHRPGHAIRRPGHFLVLPQIHDASC